MLAETAADEDRQRLYDQFKAASVQYAGYRDENRPPHPDRAVAGSGLALPSEGAPSRAVRRIAGMPQRPLVAARTSVFSESAIREMTRLSFLHDAIKPGAGLPDFPAPDFVKRAAIEAI